jgi:hypothetical protein
MISLKEKNIQPLLVHAHTLRITHRSLYVSWVVYLLGLEKNRV